MTEGNYLLLQNGAWAWVRPLLDAVWYLEGDETLRRKRLLSRHMQFGRDEAAAQAWMVGNDDLNAQLIAHSKVLADWIYAC